MNIFEGNKRMGVFGPSESGKTTLAKKIALWYNKNENRPAIVLDPVVAGNWGQNAKVFTSSDEFLAFIETAQDSLLIIDDSSVSIDRDKTFNGVFTVMRHKGHKILVIGHSARNLLPQMRDQLQQLFLFLQNEDSVKMFQTLFPAQDLMPATKLNQFEFMVVSNYKPAQRFKLTL